MEENNETGLAKITDALGTAITGIPAPIKKNFLKAFGQLCTAAVDVPVAWLEGQASEIRAANEARVQIIQTEGKGIADQINAPKEYVLKASAKYASKIIREQVNLDAVMLHAAEDIQTKDEVNEPQREIDDDWLNEFESQARLKSADDMRLIFGKILSGEILQPGTFSIKTVRLVSQLDSSVARLFQVLSNIAVSWRLKDHIIDARVSSLSGDAGSNALSDYGLAFTNLNVLQEHGLITVSYGSSIPYELCIMDGKSAKLGFHFQGKIYQLRPKEGYDPGFQMTGVELTKTGKELLCIMPVEVNEAYSSAFIKYLESQNFDLIEV